MESLDAAAVAQVRAGDREAFRPLVERHSAMIFGLAYRMTGNEADAEEIVQETFLRAYRGLGSFDGRASFGTWVFRIASNCALDLLDRRKTQPQPAVVEPDEEPQEERLVSEQPNAERLLYSAEIQARVAEAMQSLTAVERVAFLLRHFEGQSIEQIAATLKVGTGAAKQSVFRAVQKMRVSLAPAVRSAR